MECTNLVDPHQLLCPCFTVVFVLFCIYTTDNLFRRPIVIYVILRERIYVILFFQARTNLWVNVFDSRQNLWYVTFSYVAEYVSFYFAMKEKSWFNTFDTADLVLFDFSLYEAKFVLFDSSRQGRITSLFIMSH
jgi:hypothetical protein